METRKSLQSAVRDGDWLLFRRRDGEVDPVTAAITVGGRSPYFHAGMACWFEERLMCAEAKQFVGGRVVLVANLLAADPGLAIDVRHIESRKYRRDVAVCKMLDFTGLNYGWRALLRATLSRVVLLRWFIRPSNKDTSNGDLPYCSMAVSRASRMANLDPVVLLADKATEPGDLGRVPESVASYAGTLYLDKRGKIAIRKEVIPCD